MRRGDLWVAFAVCLSSCATCASSMAWQSRRLAVTDALPKVFYVLAESDGEPHAINLSQRHGDITRGAYRPPAGAIALTDPAQIAAAAATLSHPERGDVMRLVHLESGPPVRISMEFSWDDFASWSEYEVRADGSVRPISERTLDKGMGIVAAGWAMVAAFATFVALRAISRR